MNRINSKLIKIGRILMPYLVTESARDDSLQLSPKFQIKKFSINILVYLELVFALVLDTIQEIEVRSYSKGKKIIKYCILRVLLVKKLRFILKIMTKLACVFSLKLLRGFFLLALDVSSQLVSVTENDIKIRPILINSEFMLFIMNLSKSRYAYSNLNLEFLNTFL